MPTSSRQRYRQFVADYNARRLDEALAAASNAGADASTAAAAASSIWPWKNAAPRQHLGDYIHWLRPHRRTVAIVGVFALIAAGLEMIEPLFMRHIVDKILLNPSLDLTSRLVRLNLTGAMFLGFVLFKELLNVTKNYRQRLLNAHVMLTLRRALFDRLLHLPLPKVWEMKTGGILSRLTGDVDTTTGLMQMAIVSPSLSLVRLLVGVGILLTINWRLALTAMAVIPGAMVISFTASRRVRPIYRTIRHDAEILDGRVGETFSGIRIVRAFGRESRELFDYLRGRHDILRKELFAHRRELLLWTSWGLLTASVNVVIVWYGGYLNIRGRATVGDIMAFQWYTFLLMGPVWNIVNSFSELQRSLAAMERVFDVLSMEKEKPDRPHAIAAPATVAQVRLDDVSFEYRQGLPVVKHVDVDVAGGTVVALVGRSGAGKTTITDLIARFHDPTEGRILVNGTDIRDFRLASYRGLLAIVQQEVFLFDGSVRDNIGYGRVDATDADIEDAARRANAHEFIEKLPEGYETTIGERGVKLSGGQQQRLAIARALLARPQILILDEATSNLDTESEQLIQAAMTELLAGRTTFIIAHRLSTVRRADLILVMADGRVVERGTHQALMDRGGVYRAMVLRQAASASGTMLDDEAVDSDTILQ